MIHLGSTLLILLSAIILFAACNKNNDNACSPSYAKDIRPVINQKCAISGCHFPGGLLPDYTEYSSLKERIDNGRFQSFVFDLKIMPPANAAPLTEDEKAILKCWIENGAPHN